MLYAVEHLVRANLRNLQPNDETDTQIVFQQSARRGRVCVGENVGEGRTWNVRSASPALAITRPGHAGQGRDEDSRIGRMRDVVVVVIVKRQYARALVVRSRIFGINVFRRWKIHCCIHCRITPLCCCPLRCTFMATLVQQPARGTTAVGRCPASGLNSSPHLHPYFRCL